MNISDEKNSIISKRGDFKKVAIVIGYIIAFIYAAYARLLFSLSVISTPYAIIADSDAARYFRLIDLISHNYPSLPMFDSFANFPWGMKEQLPPVWAFLEASFAMIVNRLIDMPVAIAAAFFPLLIGFAFVVPAYYASKHLFGKTVGHVVVIISLFFPATIQVSSFGMVDHHVADLFLFMSIIALTLSSYRNFAEGKIQKASLIATLTGMTISFTLLVSLSSILIVVILMTTFLGAALLLSQDERKYASWAGVLSLTSAAFIMLLMYAVTPWFDSHLSSSGLSLLQPLILICFSGLILISQTVNRLLAQRKALRVIVLLGIFTALGIIALTLPGVHEKIVYSFYRSIAYYPLGMVTSQNESIFAGGLQRALTFFFALMLGFAILIRYSPKTQWLEFGKLLFVTWFAVAGAYFAIAGIYIILLLPTIIIWLGLLVAKLVVFFGKFVGAIGGNKMERPGNAIAWLVLTVILASFLVFKLPSEDMYNQLHDADRVNMLNWIKENTPKASHYYNPTHTPEYGIASEWSFGEHIELVAERPILATGNHETGIVGIVTSHKIFQANSENEAISIMTKHRLRYVLINKEYHPWVGNIEKIGESGPNPYRIAHIAKKAEIPRKQYMQLANVRMYKFWGAGSEKDSIEPLQHFRLIHVTGSNKKHAYKLFELVKGARLSIKTAPGAQITIATKISAEGIKPTDWKIMRKAGANGEVEICLPYATNSNRYPVKADVYRISIDNKAFLLNVSEDDTLRIVPLKFCKKA